MKADADVRILGLWRASADAGDGKSHLKKRNRLFSHLVFIVSSQHPLVISVVFTTAAETSTAIPLFLSIILFTYLP